MIPPSGQSVTVSGQSVMVRVVVVKTVEVVMGTEVVRGTEAVVMVVLPQKVLVCEGTVLVSETMVVVAASSVVLPVVVVLLSPFAKLKRWAVAPVERARAAAANLYMAILKECVL